MKTQLAVIASVLASLLAVLSLTCYAEEASTREQALHVLNRLAYGPAPGDVERVAQMGIDRYIAQQLQPESIPLPDTLVQKLKALAVPNQTAGATLQEYQDALKNNNDGSDEAKKKRRELVTEIVVQTTQARLYSALESPRQLQEVMLDFWFNHFNVFSGKGMDRALIASYERDAIRPYVLGSFRDLLGATAKHPAMLFYLDNWLSTAADYQANKFSRRGAQGEKAKSSGLNENYARELMELHTLGVDGGYTQKDVTELARMLTGWSFTPRELMRDNRNFHFDADRHDNGDKEWLGKHISPRGQAEGELALDILAMHPSTARHISYQLAQYFVADQPPAALVEAMTKRYLDTHGDIRMVLQTLFSSAEFRNPAVYAVKYKTPYQFVLSAVRAGNLTVNNVRPLLGAMSQLGMPLYGSLTPDGYKNTEQAWLNPDALSRRINFATALATGRLALNKDISDGEKMGKKQLEKQAEGPPRAAVMDPIDFTALLNTLAPGVSAHTLNVVNSNPAALRSALLLGSPDFMQH